MSTRAQRYKGKQMLVVGLGASGHSALRYLAAQGADLVATDSRPVPPGIEALRSELPKVSFRLGGFDAPTPFAQFSEAVVSPGVSLDEPFVQALSRSGVPLIGDIELFARAVKSPVLAVTGSNGKSTVTSLIGDMAKEAGLQVAVGGNLGPPALDLLAAGAELYVLELSSFQLETTHSLKCKAAAYLNLSEDHLDRHGSLARYGQIKSKIFQGAEFAICNAEDPATQTGREQADQTVSFAVSASEADYRLETVSGQNWLCAHGQPLCAQHALKIRGEHNLSNALAAMAMADASGIDRDSALRALAEFRGLPHRCEVVAESGGVSWLNDSKGTNVGSTVAALNGLDGPILWLGGGQGKGQDFSPLADPLAKKGRAALLFGQDAKLIRDALIGILPIHARQTLDEALDVAASLAEPGDTVLLSPACASLDQFANYVERGQAFRSWVEGRCAA